MSEVRTIGVVGAGSMGSGIAQLACLAGYDTLVYDPIPAALESGLDRLRSGLAKGAERERWSADEADQAAARVSPCDDLGELARCDLAIEAAPEDLDLKRSIFATLSAAGSDELLLATNTSSLPVSAIAAAAAGPERVVGMHFFNPPPLMKLVEIVTGAQTAEATRSAAEGVAGRMGRTAIHATDAPGFLANRLARPYRLEALRLLGEGIAGVEQIDRICRVGAGFRMGPFELADLVGIDVGFEVNRSLWEQAFFEPRWRPHPLEAQMVAAGTYGRKSGRGWYSYDSAPHRPDDPRPDAVADDETTAGLVDLTSSSLALSGSAADAIGYFRLPGSSLVELVRGRETTEEAATEVERRLSGAGLHVEWVGDSPGCVLGRIVAQIVNEAAFALAEGIGSAEDVDTAMRLGFNYPRGPREWHEALGTATVIAILDGLHRELGDPAYRACGALRRGTLPSSGMTP